MQEQTRYLGAQLTFPEELVRTELRADFKNITVKELSQHVILATTTSYKDMNNASDRLRAGLAYEMLRKASELGYTTIVVDANSDAGWRNIVKQLPQVKLIDEDLSNYKGEHFMGKSRRQCLDIAANYGVQKVIVWIEPEKHPMIKKDNIQLITDFPLTIFSSVVYTGIADIVVPRRKDNLKSYPFAQQVNELTGNMTLFDMVRSYAIEKAGIESVNNIPYLDYWVGPRAIGRNSIDAFLQYSGLVNGQKHDRWESIFNPIVSEMLAGKVVRGVAVDYIHPNEQTQLEAADPSFSAKRLDQLVSIVAGVDNVLKERDAKGLGVLLIQV